MLNALPPKKHSSFANFSNANKKRGGYPPLLLLIPSYLEVGIWFGLFTHKPTTTIAVLAGAGAIANTAL